MTPFDQPFDTARITGDWIQYANSIDENYLDVCQGQIILEIAAGDGKISQKILARNPKYFTMVDPGSTNAPIALGPTTEFLSTDVNHWLAEPRPADVVVCFGLLYHLHSPLHLMELIVNQCNPEVIILDSWASFHPLAYIEEKHNIPGNRYVRNGWKYSPYVIPTPFSVINKSLDYMGYGLDKTHHLRCSEFEKSKSWVASWKKKSDNQI